GFDAAVIEQAERRSVLKRFAAPPLFTYAAFETWLRTYDHRRGRFDVAVDGADGDAVRDAIFTIVSNTTPYTFFGSRPVVVAPAAALDAPFELMIMTTRRTTDILRVAASALGSGRFIRHNPGIALRHAAARVRVTGHGPFPYQVDGEYLGEVDELTIAYEPDALTVVTPVDPTRRARARRARRRRGPGARAARGGPRRSHARVRARRPRRPGSRPASASPCGRGHRRRGRGRARRRRTTTRSRGRTSTAPRRRARPRSRQGGPGRSRARSATPSPRRRRCR